MRLVRLSRHLGNRETSIWPKSASNLVPIKVCPWPKRKPSLRGMKVELVKFPEKPILNRVFWLKDAKTGQIWVSVAKRCQISVLTERCNDKKVWSRDDLDRCPGQFWHGTTVQPRTGGQSVSKIAQHQFLVNIGLENLSHWKVTVIKKIAYMEANNMHLTDFWRAKFHPSQIPRSGEKWSKSSIFSFIGNLSWSYPL